MTGVFVTCTLPGNAQPFEIRFSWPIAAEIKDHAAEAQVTKFLYANEMAYILAFPTEGQRTRYTNNLINSIPGIRVI